MSVIDKLPARDVGLPVSISSVIVIAGSETQKRIAAALADQGLCPSTQLVEPAALAGQDLDESTIVIFACDVEVPREMTQLRRLCREARQPAIVVISPPATGAGVRRTLDAGADALVFESEIELTLAAAIRAVASGQSVVPRKLRASVERPNLSHREHQVLTLVDQGRTNAEIAETLYLAESTVKSHLASIFTKFGVHSRKEAAAVFADLQVTSAATISAAAAPDPSEIPAA
jgi:DNA-binding NarL/FixJ family response regulator